MGNYIVNPGQPPQYANPKANKEVEQPGGNLCQHLNYRHDVRNHIECWKNSRHA